MGAARLEKKQRVGEGCRKRKGGKGKTAKGKGLAEEKKEKKKVVRGEDGFLKRRNREEKSE